MRRKEAKRTQNKETDMGTNRERLRTGPRLGVGMPTDRVPVTTRPEETAAWE